MERLGLSLSPKPKQSCLGDSNTQECDFILIWGRYEPNFICIHQIYKSGTRKLSPDKMKNQSLNMRIILTG